MFSIDSLRFDEAYKILDSSFTPDELKTYPRLLSDFIFGSMKIFALGDEDSLFAVLTLWEFKDFAFVENFAVREDLRNSGLGTKLIEDVIAHFPHKNILLEVEVPETDIQKRRVKFYEAKGFTLSSVTYIQPQLRDTPSDVKLSLMFTGDSLENKQLLNFKEQVFERVYGLKEIE